ncbi:MAG TPA: CPBP family intramembrane glutamic endopeptidase [Candidatus Saccharimonadales bacterium]|nr:CPBP family intramembrane glutamic endopeptidase [Candidatus Saccharimonadales bacterium]
MWLWGGTFPGSGVVVVAGVFGTIFYATQRRGEGLREIGFRMDTFLPALREVILATLPLAALLLVSGLWFGRLRSDWMEVVGVLPRLVAWGLIQQTILQGFVHRRFREVLSGHVHVELATAAFFAACHVPNLRLMAATFVGGYVWAIIYRRHPNLPALAIAHALGSAALNIAFGPQLMRSMRVGPGYFQYVRTH